MLMPMTPKTTSTRTMTRTQPRVDMTPNRAAWGIGLRGRPSVGARPRPAKDGTAKQSLPKWSARTAILPPRSPGPGGSGSARAHRGQRSPPRRSPAPWPMPCNERALDFGLLRPRQVGGSAGRGRGVAAHGLEGVGAVLVHRGLDLGEQGLPGFAHGGVRQRRLAVVFPEVEVAQPLLDVELARADAVPGDGARGPGVGGGAVDAGGRHPRDLLEGGLDGKHGGLHAGRPAPLDAERREENT